MQKILLSLSETMIKLHLFKMHLVKPYQSLICPANACQSMLYTYCPPFLSLASMREGRTISSSVLCAGAGRGPALVIMSAGAGRVPRLCPLAQIRSGHHIISRTLDTALDNLRQNTDVINGLVGQE